MVIKYKLGFDNESDDYAYLISQILQNTDSNVIKTDSEIIIFMQGGEESIKASFALLGEELPLSLYLSGQSVEEAAFMPPNRQPLKEATYLAMYPRTMRELIDSQSKTYFEIGGDVSVNSKQINGADSLKSALSECVCKLKEGGRVLLKNESGATLLSCKPRDGVLLTNLKEQTLKEFDISVDEALTLSAMERPFVIKSGERMKIVFFANDALTLLLCKTAMDEGIDALYIDVAGDADMVIEYTGIKKDAPKRSGVYFCKNDRFFVNFDFTPEALTNGEDSLFFDMSISNSFGVYAIKSGIGVKKIAGASFFTADIFESIKAEFDFGAKLAENFESSFNERALELKKICFENKSDIENFFDAAQAAIGATSFADMLKKADNADVQGGVKLDFALTKNENNVALNLKKCFASLLSFKLGGVDDETLAYSVFESAIDFLIHGIDEAKRSFEVKKLHIGGEFLLSSVFVEKLKAKIKNVDIDMALNSLPADIKSVYEIAR